jgi:phospholipase C
MRDSALVTTAIMAAVGCDVYAHDADNQKTASPIKHVIVILGENRTFDHLFATYEPGHGEHVDNLLSKGIINKDGTPGPNYAKATQYSAADTTTYQISPGGKKAYNTTSNKLQAPGTSYAPLKCYDNIYDPKTGAAVNGPGCVATLALAKQAAEVANQPGHYSLLPADLPLLLTGATGLTSNWPDSRIASYDSLPAGPYPLVTAKGGSLYDTYGGSPVHRFYQMWQQLDCDATKANKQNPSGCQADLFPWVEETVSAGSNGAAPANPLPVPLLKEGNIALGFYNVAKGDVPYLTKLAREYTINDNYHQPVMGGTFANEMMVGYADALYYADSNGNPATPPAAQIENPNPLNGTNNWYTNDGYGNVSTKIGGSYTDCSDAKQPGVAAIVNYLKALNVSPNCEKGAYYLLNNYVPTYIGSGKTDPVNNGPFTLPPVIKQRHIGDTLNQAKVTWAWFGERWTDFKTAPGLGANYGTIDPAAYLFCNICSPFLYSQSIMTHQDQRDAHMKDVNALYDGIANNTLPAVSFVKPSTFNDGHPSSSKVDIFEAFTKKIVELVKSNKEVWEDTAILVTMDEGGGYYDSGYVQPVDYFGDGTRIPLIVVSKYSEGGHVAHEYSDHASIVKFIERNWELPKLSHRTRDNLPNPKTAENNPYVPVNGPAIGDLWGNFCFDHKDGDHDRCGHDGPPHGGGDENPYR